MTAMKATRGSRKKGVEASMSSRQRILTVSLVWSLSY